MFSGHVTSREDFEAFPNNEDADQTAPGQWLYIFSIHPSSGYAVS